MFAGEYKYITDCTFWEEECVHIYYILYSVNEIETFIFVAEEQKSNTYIHEMHVHDCTYV